MRYTRIPADTFQNLQLNAGILASAFEPSTGELEEEDLIGATTGGITFSATPTFIDYGEDIDNCPRNSKELKRISEWEAKISGTMLTMNTATAKSFLVAADVAAGNTGKITPRRDLQLDDFADIWWIGDYSDQNGNTNGGFMAIKLMNALSSGGLQVKTEKEGKGQFAFEYTAHYSLEDQDTVPFEVYIKAGTAEG